MSKYTNIKHYLVGQDVIDHINDIFKKEGPNSTIDIDDSISDEMLCHLRRSFLLYDIQEHEYSAYRYFPYYEIRPKINQL